MSETWRFATAVLLAATLAACGEDVVTFEPPDFATARATFATADGVVTPAALRWAVGEAVRVSAFVAAFADVAGAFPTFAGLPSGSAAPTAKARSGGWHGAAGEDETAFATVTRGVSFTAAAYFRYSCPGPDVAAPDRTFRFGEARVDAENLTEDAFRDGAPLLLRFDRCVAGERQVDGQAWGLPEGGELLLLLDVVVSAGDTRHPLDVSLLWRAGTVRVRFESAEHGSYIATVGGADSLVLSLATAHGALTCTPAERRCVLPDGTPIDF